MGNSRQNSPAADGQPEAIVLRQELGLLGATSLIVGVIVGTGIFITPMGLARAAGSVGLSLVLWGLCGIISLIGAVCFVELGTFIPESGDSYAYLRAAFGGVPAFLFSWMVTLALRPGAVAVMALSCAEYVLAPAFVDGCGAPPDGIKRLIAALAILTLLMINIYSVRWVTWLQIVFMVAKFAAVTIIVIGGLVKLAQGNTQNFDSGFEGSTSNPGSISLALYAGMWAYDGWTALNSVTEEIKDQRSTLPKAVFISLPLITVIYVLVNVSYFTVLSYDEIIATPATAFVWAQRVMPGVPWLMPLLVGLSALGAVNGTLFTGSRLPYVAGRNGHSIAILSMVNVQNYTPMPAAILTSALSILFILPGSIGELLNFLNFALWIFHGLAVTGLIVMRFTRKNEFRPFKVPLVVAFLEVAICVFLVVMPIILDPQWEFLYASLFILAGLIFYFPFVHFGKELPCMHYITTFLQLLLQSSPQKQFRVTSQVKATSADK